MDHHSGTWLTIIALGAFHGINPAMGWLFAVALGLQEHRRSALWRALLPLALGHALAIGCVIGLAVVAGVVLPLNYLRWVAALILIVLGATFLLRHPHPHWAAMRVGMVDLTLWSFLVASVHGAGLMVLPFFLAMSPHSATFHEHMTSGTRSVAIAATSLHAVSYLVVTAVIAFLVFEKLGLAILRKGWFNVDLFWAAALVATGVGTLLV